MILIDQVPTQVAIGPEVITILEILPKLKGKMMSRKLEDIPIEGMNRLGQSFPYT